jgi:hypothetical protein
MRALGQLLRVEETKPVPHPPEWTRAIAIGVRAFATIFDVHVPRQLNGFTGQFAQIRSREFLAASQGKVAAIQTLNGSRQWATIRIDTWARSSSNFEGFKHDRVRKPRGKTQDVIVALDGVGTSHRPP